MRVRALLKTPAFTIVALLTLALGIGVNTSMVSVVRALLFNNGPFPEAERIVQITATGQQGERGTFSVIEHGEIREQLPSLATLSLLGPNYPAVAEPGQPTVRLAGVVATADMFATFGVQPMLGRAFTDEETQPGRNNVIVISHRCWMTRYGGRSDILGRTWRIDGDTVEIVGVMPADFEFPLLWGNPWFWRPVNFTADQRLSRGQRQFRLFGRLAPNATVEQSVSALGPLALAQALSYPENYADFRYRVQTLHATLVDQTTRRTSWMLLGLSGFVLLIACANLANLQLARMAMRTRELAIRSALGASRWQLIGYQLRECLVLSLAGGTLGLLVARGVNVFFARAFSVGGREGLSIPLDGTVLLIAFAVAVGTGVLFGIVPAWLASRTDLSTALKDQARGSSAGRGQHRVRRGLVVAEVALSLVLLAGASLMQRGFAELLVRDNGWDSSQVLTALLGLSGTRYEDPTVRANYFRQLEARLAEIPGVEHAALATSLPVHGYNAPRPFFTEAQTAVDAARLPVTFQVLTTPGYFAAMGIPLVAGTTFRPELKPGDQRVAIVNESLARHLWPHQQAVGRRIALLDDAHPTWFEVIGVARDVDDAATLRPPQTPYTVYRPLSQQAWSWVYLVVRSPTPEAMADPLRRVVLDLDPDVPADLVETVPKIIATSQDDVRLAGRILVGLAALGLVLAIVGIFGVVSSLVAQRTAEFGIRMALGAQPRDVQTLVLREGFVLTGLGNIAGLIGAIFLARALGGWMPRLVDPDPVTLAVVVAVLFLVSAGACLVPARRATKADPLSALRGE